MFCIRFALAAVTLALAGTSSAAPLGIDASQIPDPPGGHRPTRSTREVRLDVLDGRSPDLLVPVRYFRNGRVYSGRYYDESGEVYSFRQARLVLDQSAPAADAMSAYDAHRHSAAGWGIASIALIPLFPLNLVCLAGEMPHEMRAESSFEEAVYDFNRAGSGEVARVVDAPGATRRR